jgi:hypothetical protein
MPTASYNIFKTCMKGLVSINVSRKEKWKRTETLLINSSSKKK